MTNESEVIEFPLKKEISGPVTMDAEAFKANLAAAYSAGAMMMRERAAKVAGDWGVSILQFPEEHLQEHVEQMMNEIGPNISEAIRALEIPC